MYFYQKIASYYLYRYTHVRDLGGGGVSERSSELVSLPPPAWSGASACSGASGMDRNRNRKTWRKWRMVRNARLFRCEKSSERYKLSQMENYSAWDILRALKCFTYHIKARKFYIFGWFVNLKMHGFLSIL